MIQVISESVRTRLARERTTRAYSQKRYLIRNRQVWERGAKASWVAGRGRHPGSRLRFASRFPRRLLVMTIDPDAKDWTWVLGRPCPECGFDTRGFPREHVGTLLRDNAAAWPTTLGQFPDVRARPNPQTWSPLEYACHVRDVFRLY